MSLFLRLILCTFFLSSCGFLIESDNSAKNYAKVEEKNTRPLDDLYCAKATNNRVSKNGLFQKKVFNYQGSLAEQVVQNYWIEMMQNPDFFTSHPKIQIFIKQGSNVRYFENTTVTSNEKPDKAPNFATVLNNFLVKEKSKKTLLQLSLEAENLTNKELTTSFSLSQFIRSNRQDFLKDSTLKTHFLKGDDALAPYESFGALKVSLPKTTSQKPISAVNENNLFPYTEGHSELKCNFDLNLFQNFTSSLLDHHQFNSYYFSRTIDKDTFYLVTISSAIEKPIKLDSETGLILGLPTKNAVPFCFKSNSKDNFLMTISTEGRDPAQHISHFIDYGFFEAENLTDLISHMKFTRHLFLKNPDRLLFESLKARSEQLTFFHTMNIPLYHMDKLGETLVYGKFNSTNQHSFVIDERSGAKILCQ